MNLSVYIPDDIETRLGADGDDLARRVLEAFVIAEYKAGRLTHADLRRLLGFSTHYALDGFIKAHALDEPYSVADLERDRVDLARVGW